MQDKYPTKQIDQKTCLVVYGGNNPSSGGAIFGGVGTAKFSRNRINIQIVKENGSYQHPNESRNLRHKGARVLAIA